MLILINAICSFFGAFLGVFAYKTLSVKKNMQEVAARSIDPGFIYDPVKDVTVSKPSAIKRKPRTADEIALANELKKKDSERFIDQMQERVIVVKE